MNINDFHMRFVHTPTQESFDKLQVELHRLGARNTLASGIWRQYKEKTSVGIASGGVGYCYASYYETKAAGWTELANPINIDYEVF